MASNYILSLMIRKIPNDLVTNLRVFGLPNQWFLDQLDPRFLSQPDQWFPRSLAWCTWSTSLVQADKLDRKFVLSRSDMRSSPAELSPTPEPAVCVIRGLFVRENDSLALLTVACNIESTPRLIIRGLADELWLLSKGTVLSVWSPDRHRRLELCFSTTSLHGRSQVLSCSIRDLSRISWTSCMPLTFLLFAPTRRLILADEEGAILVGTFSVDETPLKEDLLVAEWGLGFFLCEDASLDREVATSSPMDLLLAFLLSRRLIEDFCCLASRSSGSRSCSFHLATSSTLGRPPVSLQCSLNNQCHSQNLAGIFRAWWTLVILVTFWRIQMKL